MKKFSATKLTVALVVFALAPCARAQTQGVKDEAVRERRATTADAPNAVQTKKTEPASPSSSSPLSSPSSQSPSSSASAELKDASKGDDGADELRAQIASAASPSERARLQRELAERLAGSGRESE